LRSLCLAATPYKRFKAPRKYAKDSKALYNRIRIMDLSTNKRAKFAALRETPIRALTNHDCYHCQKIVVENQKAYWIQRLPYDVNEAIVAAEDDCRWYSWLLNKIKKSGKPPYQLDRDSF